jgi:hypothetical protein
MSQPDDKQQIRHVTLASGKTVEILQQLPLSAEPAPEPAPAPIDENTDLHMCGSCGSEMVYPLSWAEAGQTHWEILLRCPNCEWSGTGVFSQEHVERFDNELDRATAQLVDDLKALTAANNEEDVERFALALASGLILPEDF